MFKTIFVFLLICSRIGFAVEESQVFEKNMIELFRITLLNPTDQFLSQIVEIEIDGANKEANLEEITARVKEVIWSDEFAKRFISNYASFSDKEIEWLLEVQKSEVTAKLLNMLPIQSQDFIEHLRKTIQDILHNSSHSSAKALGANIPNFVIPIRQGLFWKEVEESEIPVVVDCYAKWCFPCKKMGRILSELSLEWNDRVKFVSFDVDSDIDLAKELNIRSMPTFLFFKDGKLVGRHSGALSKNALIEKMKRFIF